MKTVVIRGADRRAVEQAVTALREGEIILYPTDTLYALGCNALDARAIENLCRIKGINPDKNVLSVVCASLSQASQYARIDNAAFKILKSFTPGPYTFILPASTTLPRNFKGRKTVGVRIPDNEFARAVAEELDAPVLNASAADEGIPFFEIEEKTGAAGVVAIAFDGQIDESNIAPGTVIDLTDSRNPIIIRQGKGAFDID